MKVNTILEATRARKYFAKNPEKLKSYTDRPNPDFAGSLSYNDPARREFNRYSNRFHDKWTKLLTGLGDTFFRRYGDTWELSFDVAYALEKSKGDPDRFLEIYHKELTDEQKNILAFKLLDFYTDFMRLKTKERAMEQIPLERIKKSQAKTGMKYSDSQLALTALSNFTSMSRGTLPKETWPIIRDLTVNPSTLPKTVYRGIFYDGAKIKDREKFLKKWAPGKKPGLKPRRAQSWSTSMAVASQFMVDQDFVKDAKNGFHVMLKYEITDPSVVIADLRNFKEGRFWNQQEIIISPDATDYEVVTVIPYEDDYAMGKKRNETEVQKYMGGLSKPAASPSGIDYEKMVFYHFLNVNLLDISPGEKEKWRTLSKKTTREVKEELGIKNGIFIEELEDQLDRVYFPLYVALLHPNRELSGGWSFGVESVKNRSSVKVNLTIDVDGYRKSDEVKDLLSLTDDKSFEYGEEISASAILSIENLDYNKLVYSVDVTSPFMVMKNEEPAQSPAGKSMNDILKTQSSQDILLSDVQRAIDTSPLNQKKNVTVNFEG